jgi:hypothetical protein
MQKLLYLTFSLSQVLSYAVEIPRYFEANAGQAASPVRFLSRSADHTVFLTASEAVLAGAAGSISLRFINSRPDVEPAGIDAAPGRVNYLIGNDPSAWRTNVPTFRGVRYREIYSGIDVVFNVGEYDFLVAPGADPSRIEVEVRIFTANANAWCRVTSQGHENIGRDGRKMGVIVLAGATCNDFSH